METFTVFEVGTKLGDSRYQCYMETYGYVSAHCWKLDVLSPVVLRRRVEPHMPHILRYLDMDAWNRVVEGEAAEIASMQDFAQAWKQSIFRQASKYSPPPQ